ncbi:MAG: hypothetical protein HY804_03140 [Nitrospinae bacterium]|nr:hypothetical protein [Nitrospinota bacterium]
MAHILEHPEMADMFPAIEETLQSPVRVNRSASDSEALLYYRYYEHTPVGGKYLCAVVKKGEAGAFLLTAYLTDKIKQGEIVWKRPS